MRVNIRPGVSVLALLRHLNYQPWYALGEFVDNSVQSYYANQNELHEIHTDRFRLQVDIDIEHSSPSSIIIRDNAAGISRSEYSRAFRPAAVPQDNSGLAEFGMGMKSAACWFAPRWSVRTSSLGECVTRTVHFDVENIVEDDISELEIEESDEKASAHFTEIRLEDVFHVPKGPTVRKLKSHLTDIYREFIRQNILQLRLNESVLEYKDPAILEAPYYKEPDGEVKIWRKEIHFDFGNNLSVNGFAALRSKANTGRAGFALFRRNRVIQGSGDEGYRPAQIFGSSNSYRYQRLFGELHLQGFAVSHTKDGFRWDDNEEPFLDLLKEHLDSAELPLLRQAEGYRVRSGRDEVRNYAPTAVDNTADVLEKTLPRVMPLVLDSAPLDPPPRRLPRAATIAKRSFDVHFRDEHWIIGIELTGSKQTSDWLEVTSQVKPTDQTKCLDIRVSIDHPFMVRFGQGNVEELEALFRIAVAIAIGEATAQAAGFQFAGTVRRVINELLRGALSDA